MWNHAHNRSTAGCTSEETSGWICSWITQDRCRTSGHRNTSPTPKRAVCLSKHIFLIKSGMSRRKRLITVDIRTQVETLSAHNWIKVLNLQQSLFCLSAPCPAQLFSPLQTHSHFFLWQHQGTSARGERTDSSPWSPSMQKQIELPCTLLKPCQRPRAGSGTGLAPPGFPSWVWGSAECKIATQNPAKTTGCYLDFMGWPV